MHLEHSFKVGALTEIIYFSELIPHLDVKELSPVQATDREKLDIEISALNGTDRSVQSVTKKLL